MQKCNENAANRYSYVGEVYNLGERKRKNESLSSLPDEWSKLHKEGFIHIHDLDAYGLTYNCLTFDILRDFPYERFKNMSSTRKIISTFFARRQASLRLEMGFAMAGEAQHLSL